MTHLPISSPAGAIVLCMLLGCGPPEAPTHGRVDYLGCNPDQERKLAWSVAYMRAAAKSRAFRVCLKSSVEGSYGPGTAIWGGIYPLYTNQETQQLEYYRPCAVSTGDLREPEFVYQKTPFKYQNRLLGFAAALSTALSEIDDSLKLHCTSSSQFTSQAPTDHGYFRLQHDSPYRFTNSINLGLRVFTQFPNHQNEDYGEPTRFGTSSPAYPIDEISGILLHEILHNYGFEHGDQQNQCQYPGGYNQGRFHSLPEIVEACMSEVVEGSIALCPERCAESATVPISTNPAAVADVSRGFTCQCTPFK